jgi:DNA-binding NtrC family response regulator/tetratricopeptide (TPR) repeat protein
MAMAETSLLPAGHPTDRLLGMSSAMAALRTQIRHLATFDTVGSPHVPTVLLQGETGTGKGFAARILHDSGPRAQGPFVEVNCAAVPETMLEAELFGFEAGAFTDAKRAKPGLFEAASRGTLFLDEIDALPLVLQGKLLTAIETKQVRRLGAVTARAMDVKLIAATNAVLAEAVAAGRFRADLYHRLAVVVLGLPPLRERGADIGALAEAYIQHYSAAHGVPSKRLSAEAEAWLHGYAWPGNIRELSHVMERVTLLHMGTEVDAETLMKLCLPLAAPGPLAGVVPLPVAPAFEGALPPEAEEIRQALVQTGGNVARAARLLRMSRDTVRYRMQRYGIARSQPERTSPPAPLHAPQVGLLDSPLREGHEGQAPAKPEDAHTPPRRQWGRERPTSGATGPQRVTDDTTIKPNIPSLEPTWEQKPVVVLALELTWLETAGPESFRYDPWTERARWEQAIVDKVQGFGGILLQRTPALLTWVFGLPQTLEQLPQRAVHSAIAIRQMVVDASAPDMVPCPELRLAVHLGGVRVDSQASDPTARLLPVGETLVLPVRLLGQASPGEILITPEVGRLVDGWVALEGRPLHLHPGDSTRVDGYAVIGVNPGREAWAGRPHRTRSPFVGRERELDLLDGVLDQVKGGQGQVVSLLGEPGMGKSRLLYEFRQHLIGQHVRFAEGQCLAYGSGIPYLPVLDLLREHCGIAAGDGPEALTTKMRLALERGGGDVDTELPLLLDLLGVTRETDRFAELSADGRRARTFETLYRLFRASSRQQPLVLAVDNLHWIDPTSEVFLAGLIERLVSMPLLVLTTTRPGYRPPWGDRSIVMQVALLPLDLDASRQVVQRVLAQRPLAPALEQQLLAKAGGNPFFLEELAHTVWEQEGRSMALAVPNSIQAVLTARIDRLPLEERRLLQTAAVIGLEVPFSLLQAIAGAPEEALHRSLTHLQAAEFLYETQLFPEREYTFKHALTHEVAYGSLLPERRRALHARIVAALEAQVQGQIAEAVDRLAYHALRGEVWDKALAYGWQAGEKAMMRSAYREAAGSFEQALSALPHLPETRPTREQAIDLRLAVRSALQPSGDSGRILAYLREAEAFAVALDDPRRLAQVSLFLSVHFNSSGAHDQAIAAAQRALALATVDGDGVLQALANYYLSAAYQAQGDYRRAIDGFRQTVASLDGARRHELFGQPALPAVSSRAYLTTCHAELGTFAEGSALGDEGLWIAEAMAHPGSLMWVYYGIGLLSLRQGDLDSALPLLERAMGICQDADLPFYLPLLAAALGEAYTLAGRIADAVPLLTQAMEQIVATEMVDNQAFCHLALGEAQLFVGRLEDAHALAERALALVLEHQERGSEAYALRLLGEITAHRDPLELEPAEAHYQQALALANELGMSPLQAHCHRSLGMLYRQTGLQAQARTELRAAIALYRAMEMTFWLPQTEAALAEVQGDAERCSG